MAPDRFAVSIDGRDLELSNLDKLMYPAAGFTKGEVIDYYTRIAPVILPHLADRAVTRIRYPERRRRRRTSSRRTSRGVRRAGCTWRRCRSRVRR